MALEEAVPQFCHDWAVELSCVIVYTDDMEVRGEKNLTDIEGIPNAFHIFCYSTIDRDYRTVGLLAAKDICDHSTFEQQTGQIRNWLTINKGRHKIVQNTGLRVKPVKIMPCQAYKMNPHQ